MTPSGPVTLVLCFEESAPLESRREALERLDLPEQSNRRVRWHDSSLLTAVMQEWPDERAVSFVGKLPGVRKLLMLPAGERIVAAKAGARSGVLLANGVLVGGARSAVIAGPCSVESESQVREIAAFVHSAGAAALRGGAYKPRTSPYSFGGLGEEGLRALARAREDTGLPIVTEVLDTADVESVAAVADVLQIGSRNMHNFPLLYKAGRNSAGRPVLLKRGFAATIDELLEAAEYVALGRIATGHDEPGIILCERGIRSFDRSTRFTLDVGAIPVIQERTHLPVVADPSHPAGLERYVLPLARAALAAGADGLLVEVHLAPEKAWCDGQQSLSFGQFERLMHGVRQLDAMRPV